MTPAEQYRLLVSKLEQISEADINPETGDSYTSIANAPLQEPPGAEPQGGAAKPAGSGIETIDAPTFNKAYAQAKAKGLKQFKWCGTYAVKDAAKKPQGGGAKRIDVPAEPQRRQFGGMNPNVELGPLSGSDLPIAP
jgi:hypothetical protein